MPQKTVAVRDLVDMPEIARRASVSKPTVRKWRARHTPERVGRKNAFPKPVKNLAIGDLWDWKEVRSWLRSPRTLVLPPRSTGARKDPEAAAG